MPRHQHTADHDAVIRGDQHAEYQGKPKAELSRQALEKGDHGTEHKMHQQGDARRKPERGGNTCVAGDVQGDISVIPGLYAEAFVEQKPHAHLPEENKHKDEGVIHDDAQSVISFSIFGQNTLFEDTHFGGRPEDEKQYENAEAVGGEEGKNLMSRIEHADCEHTEHVFHAPAAKRSYVRNQQKAGDPHAEQPFSGRKSGLFSRAFRNGSRLFFLISLVFLPRFGRRLVFHILSPTRKRRPKGRDILQQRFYYTTLSAKMQGKRAALYRVCGALSF